MSRLANLFRRKSRKSPTVSASLVVDDTPQTASLSPLASPLQRQGSGIAAAVQERLSKEVVRKLRLATNAEEKEDRDIVCSEVFADITGELNAAARGKFRFQMSLAKELVISFGCYSITRVFLLNLLPLESTGAIYKRWYEVLATYYCRAESASETVLALCRQLWGQPFTAPIFALLLHQWLLVQPTAGGTDQRLKHLNILMSGARQLFLGDIEAGEDAFRPLYSFIAEQVVLPRQSARLQELPPPARDAISALVAAFLPYYFMPEDFNRALDQFPPPHMGTSSSPFVTPRQSLGVDFAIDRIIELLGKEVRTESAVQRYLQALETLQNSHHLNSLRTATRIRLQGELYALTQPGGPRYASRTINRRAFRTLDILFPHGRRTRRVINLAFRFLHPQEWPWVWWDTCGTVIRLVVLWVADMVRAGARAAAQLRRIAQ